MYHARYVAGAERTVSASSAYRRGVSPANPRGAAFGALIREARLRAQMTQEELVDRSGVSRSTILRWESGEANRPDPDQVRAAARALNVDPIRAAIALGYISADDLGDRTTTRPLSPEIADVVRILEDPTVPASQKADWVAYLRYLRAQQRKPGEESSEAV